VSWFSRRDGRHEPEAGRSSGGPESGHDVSPIPGTLPDDVVQAIIGNLDPDYVTAIQNLGEQLRGKVVGDSSAGHAGYRLRFTDGTWLVAWLDPALSRMQASMGVGDPPTDVVAQLSNPAIPDASAPLGVDRPHATEPNDIATEARRTLGQPITGVAIGARAFSLCFPNGRELEGTVLQNADGQFVLRVFYEQW
jgi:hypothetical protein